MKKVLITTLLFLMSFTSIQAKEEVMVVSEREALIEVNPINVSSDAKSVEGFVARLYRLALGREPDKNGFNYWVNNLKAKKIDGADTVVGFFESKEVTNKKLSNKAYLQLLYKAVLNRKADDGGLKYWFGVMDEQVTKTFVLKGFVESNEFTNLCNYYGIARGYVVRTASRDMNLDVTKFVNRLYSKCLGRKADVKGLDYWTKALLEEGKTGAEVVKGFFDSKEVANKNLNAKNYVTLLYNTLFNRSPDTNGLNHWVNKLNDGSSREDILAGFVESQEFKNLCAKYGIEPGTLKQPEPEPEPEPEVPDTVESNAQSVFEYITKTLGYSKPVACGMMANMYHESHFLPTVGNYYYGICQWGGGRRSNLFTWCNANGYDPNTVKGQLHFMNHELTTIYVNTYNSLLQVADSPAGAGEACNIFLHGFEGASVYDGRYELAISYYNQMP